MRILQGRSLNLPSAPKQERARRACLPGPADGYIAARGRPDRPEPVLGYLRDLSGETEISRPSQPMASSQPDPAITSSQ